MKRKLGRVGDVISYTVMNETRRGKVTMKSSEYLTVSLESPRTLQDWEKQFPATSNPMEDYVYLHSNYTIEAYGNA